MGHARSLVSFNHALWMIPDDRKANTGGEDAAFSSSHFLGVADGVGGWAQMGVDPARYSRELMEHTSDIVKQAETSGGCLLPQEVLTQVYDRTRTTGSSTCCLVSLHATDCRIFSGNLGDSGFLIYRPSVCQFVCSSKEQTHSFNYPFQLGTGSHDTPQDADLQEFPVETGDLVLLATDGVFDNVFEKDLCEFLRGSERAKVQTIARDVAEKAYQHSGEKLLWTPWSEKASQHAASRGMEWRKARRMCVGGKSDDITVVAARVVEAEGSLQKDC